MRTPRVLVVRWTYQTAPAMTQEILQETKMTSTEVQLDDINTELARNIIEAVILSTRLGIPAEDIIDKYIFKLKETL